MPAPAAASSLYTAGVSESRPSVAFLKFLIDFPVDQEARVKSQHNVKTFKFFLGFSNCGPTSSTECFVSSGPTGPGS